ncbi:hypothetical protein ES332_A06G169200v1 [Gossypium tomentosum]|uniref:Uncharacterized protein n=1 Tax=Gossypium tomentosum TaxID=34277 RepID=A0A5D2Q7F2_GOSTO|nr:hypothetical protein ES332_A06G169200v1 [Gossypium tomentosum]
MAIQSSSNIQNYFSFLLYPSHILFKLPSKIFSTNLKDYRNVWSEQEEEGFERTTVAAIAKKISITKKALIPVLIKPSRMSKEISTL